MKRIVILVVAVCLLGLAFGWKGADALGGAPQGRARMALYAPEFTYVVDSDGDQADDNVGNHICHTAVNTCTLRAAIEESNNDSQMNNVVFTIGAGGIKTLQPQTEYDAIENPIVIDGTTQPGCAHYPCIEINGQESGSSGIIIDTTGRGSTIRGLVINNFDDVGIGSAAHSDDNVFVGNYIGTDVTGNVARPNQGGGMFLRGDGNRIGGTTAADRNVISGNTDTSGNTEVPGITLVGDATIIQGNYIGTNAAGTAALPNDAGISGDDPTNNVIGGTAPGARNIISGNGTTGIHFTGDGGTHNKILGNYIGVDVTGAAAVPNQDGIIIADTHTTLIGDTMPGAGNVISGNQYTGVITIGDSAAYTFIVGNKIGTDATGTYGIPNKIGIEMDGSFPNYIGAEGYGNIIAYNTDFGVSIANDVLQTAIRFNSLHHNGLKSITLNGFNPPLANDAGDPDEGANRRQNVPLLTSAVSSGGALAVEGSIDSVDPNSKYPMTIQFFASPACQGQFGTFEAQDFLGSLDVAGPGDFTANLNVSVPAGHVVSSTATDDEGNTSEISDCLPVTADDCSQIPDVATHLKPKNGAISKHVDTRLNWEDVPCAVEYTIVVKEDSISNKPFIKEKHIPQSKYVTPALTTGHNYYWRVQACNDAGCSAWSTYARFRVGNGATLKQTVGRAR